MCFNLKLWNLNLETDFQTHVDLRPTGHFRADDAKKSVTDALDPGNTRMVCVFIELRLLSLPSP
jgi:hypothetical protein